MNNKLPIRIGTRSSKLALWQANKVKSILENHGHHCMIVPVNSMGDINLTTPLYAMGVQGVFTRALDVQLLNNQIDIAVHSMKDVPVQLPLGISQAAVLQRGNFNDVLVRRKDSKDIDLSSHNVTIATGSIRRKAQWLNHYPGHEIDAIRGNIQTRLQKLQDSNWHGAIFAAAGLERMNSDLKYVTTLDWMLPAPAQGAIMVVCRTDDHDIFDKCKIVNHDLTAMCVKIERDFLRVLHGGCSAPISALALEEEGEIYFKGNILMPDGSSKIEISKKGIMDEAHILGEEAAQEVWRMGGDKIVEKIRNEIK